MDRQGLNLFIVFSLIIHLSFFSLSFIILKKDNHAMLPSSYVVDLVSPVETASNDHEKGSPDITSSPDSNAKHKTGVSKLTERDKQVKEKKLDSIKDKEYLSERIDAIRAKKRVEQIVGLRKTISLQAGITGKKGTEKGVEERGGSPDDYYSRITSEIWKHWGYPDMGSKDMEAIIVIKVRSDGSVQVKGVEKTSGNSLFDRSAIWAILKASPLSPPPYEMEIGVRFCL